MTCLTDRVALTLATGTTAQSPAVPLEAGAVWSALNVKGALIRAHAGELWVTQEGDGADHVLRAGETFVVSRRGRVVVQALSRGAFSVGR